MREFKKQHITRLLHKDNQKRKRPQDPIKEEIQCSSPQAHFELTKALRAVAYIVCKAQGTKQKCRRVLTEISLNTRRGTRRTIWRCNICEKPLCKAQHCIDRHLMR
jgi:hypothetical protein